MAMNLDVEEDTEKQNMPQSETDGQSAVDEPDKVSLVLAEEKSRREAAEKRIASMENAYDLLNKRFEEQSERLLAIEAEKSFLEEKLIKWKQGWQQKRSEMAAFLRQREDFKVQSSTGAESLHSTQEAFAAQSARVAELEVRVADLENRLVESDLKKAQQEMELTRLRRLSVERKQQLDSFADERKALEANLSKWKKGWQMMRDREKTTQSNVYSELETLKARNAELENALATERSLAAQEADTLRDRNVDLRKSLREEVQRLTEHYESRVTQLSTSHQQEMEMLKGTLVAERKQETSMSEEQWRSQIEAYQQEIQALQAEVMSLQEKYEVLSQSSMVMSENLRSAEAKVVGMEGEFQELFTKREYMRCVLKQAMRGIINKDEISRIVKLK
eukprot:GILJ01004174.1.p1 GENE.GILJ01004174.1~~GILJ01004174.1.p1  ORF type:complete len:391 (-),score=85.92 GILJ01004174.1:163-1335(-)